MLLTISRDGLPVDLPSNCIRLCRPSLVLSFKRSTTSSCNQSLCDCGLWLRVKVRTVETAQTPEESHLCVLSGWVRQQTFQKQLVVYFVQQATHCANLNRTNRRHRHAYTDCTSGRKNLRPSKLAPRKAVAGRTSSDARRLRHDIVLHTLQVKADVDEVVASPSSQRVQKSMSRQERQSQPTRSFWSSRVERSNFAQNHSSRHRTLLSRLSRPE